MKNDNYTPPPISSLPLKGLGWMALIAALICIVYATRLFSDIPHTFAVAGVCLLFLSFVAFLAATPNNSTDSGDTY